LEVEVQAASVETEPVLADSELFPVTPRLVESAASVADAPALAGETTDEDVTPAVSAAPTDRIDAPVAATNAPATLGVAPAEAQLSVVEVSAAVSGELPVELTAPSLLGSAGRIRWSSDEPTWADLLGSGDLLTLI
jgi:hypothetical protein